MAKSQKAAVLLVYKGKIGELVITYTCQEMNFIPIGLTLLYHVLYVVTAAGLLGVLADKVQDFHFLREFNIFI
ncbi:hypothetical protein LA52FAK_40320 [Desulforhopalus sp. 52FAK]